ncbi:serine hydrolase domain-containing protein [Glycomyces tritici]|uniref:Serine hydrolase domain-containing protein n=1 Tax=Glycomyces tritici TaxID=2665176 RepID=A0ABT7YVV7_9ACTN|nr:serine hydrolase domain-containing protein [Glycomyces tritici]MDN3242771.1 serine hydrolase domain-containing protein [Glycomyces tritici]
MYTNVIAAALAALAPLTGPLPQAPSQDQTDLVTAVGDYLDASFADAGVPGAAYAILSADGDVNTAFWGEDGDGEPVGEDTPFLWGSVAKPVTATAAMTLVEDGLLDLDEPVVTYLPDFALANTAHSDRITVRHLLEQTSGIPEGTGITDRFEHRDDPYGDAVADLADVDPIAEPGEAFAYASANYVVAGAVVEAVAGVPYVDYLRSAVLDPLGMDGAVLTAGDAAGVADGFAPVFGRAARVEARFDEAGPSYGYLGGDIGDLAAFAGAHLGRAAVPVVSGESLALMHGGAVGVSDSVDYGLGWRVDSRNADLGVSTVWHTGAAPGFSAGVLLLPELGRALVVAQNRYGHFEEGVLIGAMLGAVRILAGGAAEELAVDPLYVGLLAGLSLLVVAAVVFAVWSVVRVVKRAGSARGGVRVVAGAVCWVLAAAVVAYVSWVVVPGLAPSRVLFFLLAPDVAWLLTVLGVVGVIVAVCRVWLGWVRWRGRPV